MKKILFCCYGLGIGGIEKCLVNLLNVLDKSKYEIDVLLMNPEYDMKDQIRTDICYIDTFKYVFNTTDTKLYLKDHWRRIIPYLAFRIAVKLKLKPWKVFKKLPKEYDVAIAYSQHDYSPYFVIDKVKASKKILWYHNGEYEKTGKEKKCDQKYFLKFDNIIAVSSDCKEKLITVFPDIKEKVLVIHNIVDYKQINEKSYEKKDFKFDKKIYNIVTVGRLTIEKGMDLVIKSCVILKQLDKKICWYWIGDGNQREETQKKIKELGLSDYLILCGNKSNPYPYMKECNLYVQPSHYEAYCTTTNEAKILKKVVIATDVGGMKEQIINGKTGYVVNISEKDIVEKILFLYNHPEKVEEIEKNLKAIEMNQIFDAYITEYAQLF